ncbi:MAG: Cys-Gln thioester bond-forming surface protein [Erysipelotrichaceae bacterium]|nr:Cys-Gln thioester bond-forming surface protein [Erysipelotrichaceae bacterium]
MEKFKKLLTCLLSLLMMSSVVTNNLVNVKAATGDFTVREYDTGYTSSTGSTIYRLQIQSDDLNIPDYSDSSSGYPAFCVQHGASLESGEHNGTSTSVSSSTTTDYKNLARLAYLAYYYDSDNLKNRSVNNELYAMTQELIWQYLGQDSSSYTLGTNYSSWKSNIMDQFNKWDTYPSFNSSTLTLDLGETKTLTDSNGVLQYYETFSYTKNGVTFKHTKGSNTMTVSVSSSCTSSTVSLTESNAKSNGISKYENENGVTSTISYFVQPSNDRQRFICTPGFSDAKYMSMTVNVNLYGNLKITKQDNNGNYISGTTFKVSYNSDMSNPLGTYTTGSDGTVTVEELKPGTVYVQETSVPDNLILDKTIYSVTVVSNDTASYTATNDIKQGYIKVTKYDSKTGEIVKQSGVEFEILSDDTVVETIITDKTGVATSGLLDYGTYIIREKTNPENYVIATTTESQSVTEDGKTYSVSIYNEPVAGSICLTKEDSETGSTAQGDATLTGATYVLKAAEDILEPATGEVLFSKGEIISVKTFGNSTWGDTGEKTTNSNAEISWSNLPMGKYVIEETKASEGYLLAEDINVTLTPENNTVSTVSKSVISQEDVIKGKLQISKIGSNGSSGVQNGLEGVEFTIKLYSEVQSFGWDEATTYDVLTTDSTGRATSIDLPYGVYLVKETYTPENYYAGGDFFVTIDEDEEIEYRVVNNSPFKAWLKLVKSDENGNEITLSNATFKLKDADGNYVSQKSGWTYIDTWTTDEDGIAYLSNMVETGTYYVEEITSPDGFLLADEVKVEITSTNESITFDEDNDPVITVTIIDEKPTGTIILNKSTENAEDIINKCIKFQLTANSDIIDPADGSVIYSKGDIVTIDNEDGIYEINENGYLQITGLPLGSEGASYLLSEVETQDGYVLLEEPIQYDFTIQNNTTKVYEVIKSAENKLTETYFSKTDVGGNEIEGAQMVLTDNTTGIVIDEWTSTNEEHLVKGLIYGHEYTLSEITAPDGYVLSTDITFVYSDEIEKVTMTDKQVFVSKEDIAGEEVDGATIQVIDEDGNIIDEWVSTNESHPISGLEEGKTYTLHEETAPNGYFLANDIEFTVSDDKENEYHTIVDEKILTDIEVVKIDSSTGKVITGLDFAFTLYADEKCTKEIATVNANTENGTVTFDDLEYGTYYIRETQAPKGYQLSDEVIKVVVDDNLENVGNVYSLDYNNAPTPTVTVSTGDNTPIEALWWTTFVVSISGVYLARKKKKYLNNKVD